MPLHCRLSAQDDRIAAWKTMAAMNVTTIIAAIGVGLVAAATLLYIVLSAALHRQKWLVALRNAEELVEKGSARAMRRALSSDSPGERLGAAMAFSEIATRAATKALCRTLADDRDADVRSAAANALASRADEDVVARLSEAAARDKSPIVRGAAVEALGLSRSESAVPALVEVLRDAGSQPWRPGLRARIALGKLAADALGKIGGTKAIAALGAAQASRNRSVREAAEEALSLIELRHTAGGVEGDAPTLRKLAGAYIAKREFEEAIGWLDRAARIEPTHAETYETLGTLHHKLGDQRRAERCYKKAIELAPEEPFPHFGLGVIYQSRGDEAAVAEFERYLALAPDGDQARSARRFVAELTGE